MEQNISAENKGSILVEDVSVLSGANYFSGEQVVKFRINLADYAEVTTNLIEGFFEKLKETLPTLYQHYCSPKRPGGFFERVAEGTLLGHVIEHVAIELQTLAGMNVGFGKTRATKTKGVYNVVFRYQDESAGIFAGYEAVKLINNILSKQSCFPEAAVSRLIEIREEKLLGFSTRAIVTEAEKRNIPWLRLDDYNLVQLGSGKHRKIIRATTTENTSLIAVELADNKYKTGSLLIESGVPFPVRRKVTSFEEAIDFFHFAGSKIVIKPSLGGYQGKRVSVNLTNEENVKNAFLWAAEFDEEVIAQKHVDGFIYRILTIDKKYAAAVLLDPPFICGDGVKTITQLIESLNSELIRETGDKGKLSKISIDEDTLKILELRGYTTASILPANEKIILKNSGNMKLGASSMDVTSVVHPANKFICERISSIINLDVAGIDIISPDISVPLNENNGCVIEINAAPDFRMHLNPTYGEPQNVAKAFVDMLFPATVEHSIQVISVTGSVGKTLFTELLGKAFRMHGLTVGIVNTKGVYINENCLNESPGLNSSNKSVILKDPLVDIAVFETNVETILQCGLGYKAASISVVLNLDENKEEYQHYDHIIDAVDIAYAKSVVAEEVYNDGFVILNADNVLIYEMAERVKSNVALFTTSIENEEFQKHISAGQLGAAIFEERLILYQNGESAEEILNIKQVLAFDTNIASAKDVLLSALLVMIINKFSIDDIRQFLIEKQ